MMNFDLCLHFYLEHNDFISSNGTKSDHFQNETERKKGLSLHISFVLRNERKKKGSSVEIKMKQ